MTTIRRFSITFFAVLVFTVLLLCVPAGAAETVCDGCILDTFNGSPACVQSGNLHLCQNNFPDANFRTVVAETVHQAENSFLSPSTVKRIKDLNAELKQCTTLEGVGFFINLNRLYCSRNRLTSLDLTKNTKLTSLDCSLNSLKALDVRNQPALVTLDCSHNQLSILELSKNTNLTLLYCSNNRLTSLDLSKNTKLSDIHCSVNSISELQINHPELKNLYCHHNALTVLDFLNAPLLQHLEVFSNYISELNLSNLPLLQQLSCDSNRLTTLDISQNARLTYLNCSRNRLQSLILGNNSELGSLHCQDNRLTSLDLRNCTNLKRLNCQNNSIRGLDLSVCEKLNWVKCHTIDVLPQKLIADILKLPQALEVLEILDTYEISPFDRRSESPFQFDIAEIVGKENLSYVNIVQSVASGVKYNVHTGIVTIPSGVVPLTIQCLIPLGGSKNASITFSVTVSCNHGWIPASCTQLSHCVYCGSLLSHSWIPATKTEPMTCEVCHIQSGHPLEHVWYAANCFHPRQCKFCSEEDGEPLGHNWKSNNCDQGSYCTRCNRTDPTPLKHVWGTQKYCTSELRCQNCHTTKPSGKQHTWVHTSFFLPSYCADCFAANGSSYLDQFLLPIVAGIAFVYLFLTIRWIRNHLGIKEYPEIPPDKKRKA